MLLISNRLTFQSADHLNPREEFEPPLDPDGLVFALDLEGGTPDRAMKASSLPRLVADDGDRQLGVDHGHYNSYSIVCNVDKVPVQASLDHPIFYGDQLLTSVLDGAIPTTSEADSRAGLRG